MSEFSDQLRRIEQMLESILDERTPQEYYSTSEVAKILQKAEFTVREWCRNQRVNAKKRACGRGRSNEWMISHAELLRIQGEGLLPSKSANKLSHPHRTNGAKDRPISSGDADTYRGLTE